MREKKMTIIDAKELDFKDVNEQLVEKMELNKKREELSR